MNARKKFVVLQNIETGSAFWTSASTLEDETKLSDGTVAYTVVGYGDSVEECNRMIDAIPGQADRLQKYVSSLPLSGDSMKRLFELL